MFARTRATAADLLRTLPGVQTIATADRLSVIMPGDSYTIIDADPVQVLDADGEPLKMMFADWQEAVDYVARALALRAA